MSRSAYYAATAALGVSYLAIACTTDYQAGKDDPAFGDPNALSNQRPPGPSLDDPNASSSSTGGPICVKNGGTLVQKDCIVSLKDGVLKAFGDAGCGSTACHGGTTPLYEPRIEPGDGPGMWQEWQSFKLTTGKVYIDPCSETAADSEIVCNLAPTGACGSPMPKGLPSLQPQIVELVKAWVECGAPNN